MVELSGAPVRLRADARDGRDGRCGEAVLALEAGRPKGVATVVLWPRVVVVGMRLLLLLVLAVDVVVAIRLLVRGISAGCR